MLNEKEKNALRIYNEQLRMPKLKYILIHGLTWGILLLVIMSLIEIFIMKKSLQQQWEEGLLTRIIIMPFAGLLYGWISRRIIEKRFSELQKKESIQ